MTTFVRTLFPSRPRLGGFIAGLGALASVWPPATKAYEYPHRSDLDALRSDAVRIGDDMRSVIDREHARIKTQQE